jgi:hypothetical protein
LQISQFKMSARAFAAQFDVPAIRRVSEPSYDDEPIECKHPISKLMSHKAAEYSGFHPAFRELLYPHSSSQGYERRGGDMTPTASVERE